MKYFKILILSIFTLSNTCTFSFAGSDAEARKALSTFIKTLPPKALSNKSVLHSIDMVKKNPKILNLFNDPQFITDMNTLDLDVIENNPAVLALITKNPDLEPLLLSIGNMFNLRIIGFNDEEFE